MRFVVCASAFMVLWIVCHSVCVAAHKDSDHHPVGVRVGRYVKISAGTPRARRRGGMYRRRRNV